jgi:hypothetical protein
MAKDKTEAVATRTTAMALQQSKPDFLRKQDEEGPARYRGQEEIGAQDMVIPRVAICQSTTPNRKRQNEAIFIEGLQEGQIFNTVTLENYGEEILFTPLLFHKSRIKFTPMDQGGGVECLNPTGRHCALNNGGPCIHAQWGKNGEPPACDELYNFPCLVLHENGRAPDFAVISFKRTGVAAAKDLNTKIRMRQSDAFAGTYRLRTAPDKNSAGQDYFIPVIDNAGWVDPETYQKAEEFYEGFRESILSGQAVADMTGMAEERKGDEPF